MAQQIFEWTEANVPTQPASRRFRIAGSGWVTFPTALTLYVEAEYTDSPGHTTTAVSTEVLSENDVWTDFTVSFTPSEQSTVTYRLWSDTYEDGTILYIDAKIYNGTLEIPAAWGQEGTIDLTTSFGAWVETGSYPAYANIVFDPEYADGTLISDIVWDICRSIGSTTGASLDTTGAQLLNNGGGAFTLLLNVDQSGAYFKVHLDGHTDQSSEGVFKVIGDPGIEAVIEAIDTRTTEIAEDVTALTEALGSGDDDMMTVLTQIRDAIVNVIYQGGIEFKWYEYEEGHDGDVAYAIEGVIVAAYNNDSMTGDPVNSAITDEQGVAKLYLPEGTYYLWRRKAGRSFTNPIRVVVSQVVGDEVDPPEVGDIHFDWYEYEADHDGEPEYGIENVLVRVFDNAEGTGDPVKEVTTDSTGKASFHLPSATYYLFRSKYGRTFTNPVEIIVG